MSEVLSNLRLPSSIVSSCTCAMSYAEVGRYGVLVCAP